MVKFSSAGITLLEILFAMALFLVTMASFAMVFPSGYHLNLKSFRENQAVHLAKSILEEMASKPVFSPNDNQVPDSLNNLSFWKSESDWAPQALVNFRNQNPSLAQGYNFHLPSTTEDSKNPGIVVTFLYGSCLPATSLGCDPLGGGSNNYTANISTMNALAQISVHLLWQEPVNKTSITRSATLSTFASYNKE